MPVPVFPKSIASPSIMAYIMTQKYIVYFRITLRSLLEIDEHLLCQNQLEMETASGYTPLADFS